MAGRLNGETASHTSLARRGWDAHSAVSIGFVLPDGVISIPNEPGRFPNVTWESLTRLPFEPAVCGGAGLGWNSASSYISKGSWHSNGVATRL